MLMVSPQLNTIIALEPNMHLKIHVPQQFAKLSLLKKCKRNYLRKLSLKTSCSTKGTKPTLLAITSERSLITSDPGATGKFSGNLLEIQ